MSPISHSHMKINSSLDQPDNSLPPIYKYTSRKWKELPTEGDSVGINDPKLKQGYLGELKKKSKTELEELLQRQKKLLSNVGFVKKLADGGKRLQERRDEIVRALDCVHEEIAATPIPDMTALEWQWRDHSKHVSSHFSGRDGNPLDSDDDDEEADPLELLATHCLDTPRESGSKQAASNSQKKAVDPSDVIMEELKKLDIRDKINEERAKLKINSGSGKQCSSDLAQDFGAKLLISLEKKAEQKPPREVFKPFRPRDKQHLLPTNIFSEKCMPDSDLKVSTSVKGALGEPKIIFENLKNQFSTRKGNPSFGISATPVFQTLQPINIPVPGSSHSSPLWSCESSATGPLTADGTYRTVKLLSLRESIDVQRQTQERLRKVQVEEAAARLKSRSGDGGSQPPLALNTCRYAYRDKNAHNFLLEHLDQTPGRYFKSSECGKNDENDSDTEESDEETDSD